MKRSKRHKSSEAKLRKLIATAVNEGDESEAKFARTVLSTLNKGDQSDCIEDANNVFRAMADHVVEEASKQGVKLTFDAVGAKHVERSIEALRPIAHRDSGTVIGLFGPLLGECIKQTYGGRWENIDGEPAILIVAGTTELMAFPYMRIARQIENGLEDSAHAFFLGIPVALELPDTLEKS